ncbi:unnamed protein product, partial [Polarella glacialis]
VLDFAHGSQMLRRVQASLGEYDLSPVRKGSRNELDQLDLEKPELGEWRYIILDPKGITLRSRPTVDKSFKLNTRVDEGEIVNVVERRASASTVFLRLETDTGQLGWAFDAQPGPGACLRMQEAPIETGSWYYQVSSDRSCCPRSRCSSSDACKIGRCLYKGCLVKVEQRIEVGLATFLLLADGGYICANKDGLTPFVEGPLAVHVVNNSTGVISTEGGVSLLKAPTTEPWAQTRMVLLAESRICVCRR